MRLFTAIFALPYSRPLSIKTSSSPFPSQIHTTYDYLKAGKQAQSVAFVPSGPIKSVPECRSISKGRGVPGQAGLQDAGSKHVCFMIISNRVDWPREESGENTLRFMAHGAAFSDAPGCTARAGDTGSTQKIAGPYCDAENDFLQITRRNVIDRVRR